LTPRYPHATLLRVNADRLTRVEWLLVAAGLALLFFFHFHDVSGDARPRYEALVGLIEHGVVSTTPYSMVGPLVSTPVYLLGRVYASPDWWLARFAAILLALGLVVAYRLTRREDRAIVRRFFMLIVAASMFPHYVRGYGPKPSRGVRRRRPPGGALRPRPVGLDGSRDWRGEHSGPRSSALRSPLARTRGARGVYGRSCPWPRPPESSCSSRGCAAATRSCRVRGNRGAETVLPYSAFLASAIRSSSACCRSSVVRQGACLLRARASAVVEGTAAARERSATGHAGALALVCRRSRAGLRPLVGVVRRMTWGSIVKILSKLSLGYFSSRSSEEDEINLGTLRIRLSSPIW